MVIVFQFGDLFLVFIRMTQTHPVPGVDKMPQVGRTQVILQDTFFKFFSFNFNIVNKILSIVMHFLFSQLQCHKYADIYYL